MYHYKLSWINLDPADCVNYPGNANGDGIHCPDLIESSKRRRLSDISANRTLEKE